MQFIKYKNFLGPLYQNKGNNIPKGFFMMSFIQCAYVRSCVHSQLYISYRTHLFQAAHEIIADGRSRQVGSAWASPHIEEIIWAQHSVILLSVSCGGQYTIHWYSNLLNDDNIKRQQIRNSFEDVFLTWAITFLKIFYCLLLSILFGFALIMGCLLLILWSIGLVKLYWW